MTIPAIRPVVPEDETAINGLFKRVFGKNRSPELWHWLYQDSPAGPGHAVVAEVDGKMVAHAGTISRTLQVDDAQVLCGQSIDAMTHPTWQRQGLNRAVNEALRELHIQHGVRVVYGFSNEESTHSVVHYQGRTPLTPFPLMVRPVRFRNLPLRLALQNTELPPARNAVVPDDIDLLAAQISEPISVVRSAAYLKWRYSKPGGVYREVEVRQGGQLLGYGVLSLRLQMGLRVAFLAEALVAQEEPSHWKLLLDGCRQEAAESGCDMMVALAYPGTSNRTRLRKAGFVGVPKKLQPEKVVFSVKTVGSPLPGLHEPQSWKLCWGEHDLV